jgi:2-polyprenyl-3-methyl-5-hydroxy-6-metoxy-1,4-benzoquinol methylase
MAVTQKPHSTTAMLDPAFAPSHPVPSRLDRFWVRKAILQALLKTRSRLTGTLLDVGCGQMPYRPLLIPPHGDVTHYLGLDFAENPIHDNRPDLYWTADGCIPLPNASVDCAICTEVLEHCPEPETVLREVWRVLRPEGTLFLTVPFLWPLHEVPYDYYRYTPFALQRHLERAGFGVIDLHALGGWDASLAQMLGLWVRRRPMRRWLRRALSWLLWPVYLLLLRLDRRERAFGESSMVTGLWGVAVKP